MRYHALLGAVALVRAAPNTAIFDAEAFKAVPGPTLTGPPPGVATQEGVYDDDALLSKATAVVSTIATAQATVSQVARRSDLEAQRVCIFGYCFGSSKSTKNSGGYGNNDNDDDDDNDGGGYGSGSITRPPVSVTTPPVTITSAPSISYGSVPSSCTPVSWTNTFAFTSDPTCTKGPFEVGTYCGFINPEDPCAPQPLGAGPVPTPDTVPGFYKSEALSKLAKNAITPKNYTNTFRNLNASVNAISYMGLHTLNSYDPQACAEFCNTEKLCTGFNIFAERNPLWNPDQCSCTAPPSMTNFKCTIWGSGVLAGAANNFGQKRGEDFNVVIAASNGYEKINTTTPPTPDGWGKPQRCGGMFDKPRTCIGKQIFKGPFDPSVCAAYASAQNALNQKKGLWNLIKSLLGYNNSKCNFFNAAMLDMNDVAQGYQCSLYAQQYQSEQATFQPPKYGADVWKVENSWSYCLKGTY
ncbi:uncharacterized protein BCR38DRAFT_422350 [Pseudomassariella vexata]|uniref:Apple domain-containing protein n=1 Tax=Pseudomassariella vexata TaxID=1141098 RepID=A0A1Y2E9F5_9PEZI|nr:uncharacterized protein BCR38DRAFT_422350 [Pseudomassariella vexata]ORY68179.1 hypothetical protein BCR38DRAFT_422350 [Pseudomassariella vexata]